MISGRAALAARNAIGFPAMVAVTALALAGLVKALEAMPSLGFERLVLAFALVALLGFLGHFMFGGRPDTRALLAFLSVMGVGIGMVVLDVPGASYYTVLSAIPFAAVCAFTTRITATMRGAAD